MMLGDLNDFVITAMYVEATSALVAVMVELAAS